MTKGELMDIIFTIAAFLILVGLVITIHEGGHFLVGRLCGMKMLEFSIGFGPKIFEKRITKDNTLFTLRLFPLGGFVKPLDKTALKEEQWNALSDDDKSRAFDKAPRWKKASMVAGGPLANFILAFVVYFLAMTVVGTKGIEPVISEVTPNGAFHKAGLITGDKILEINGNKTKVLNDAYSMIVNGLVQGQKVYVKTQRGEFLVDYSTTSLKKIPSDMGPIIGAYFTANIGEVFIKNLSQDGAAQEAGIRENDKLISIDHINFNNIDKAIRYINAHANKAVEIVVEREGKKVPFMVTPKLEVENDSEIGKIGVLFYLTPKEPLKTVHYTMREAAWNSTQKVWDSTYTTLISIKKLVTGELSTKAISGPLSIADYSGKSAQNGLFQYMMMISAISIAVGVFNLLPIPALDGGHLAQYCIEWVMGKNISPIILHYGQVVGFGLIMGIFFFSLSNDLLKYLL